MSFRLDGEKDRAHAASRLMQPRKFVAIFGIAVVWFLANHCPAQEKPEKTVEITSYPERDLKCYEWDGMGYSSEYACTRIDPKSRKRQARFTAHFGPLKTEMPLKVRYPLASEGDVIPMFGTTWLVGHVEQNSLEQESGVAVDGINLGVVKLTKTKLADSAIMVPPNCLVIPNQGKASRYQSRWITKPLYHATAEELFQRDGVAMVRFQLTLVNQHGVKREAKIAEKSTVELKVGDQLRVEDSYRVFADGKEPLRGREIYVVKHIVLPNAEKHIMGWVALEPKTEEWPNPLKPGDAQ